MHLYNYTHPKNILVATLKRLYDYGMTTTSGGNLSIRDDEGNIWITPSGIDKGSLRPEDIIKVTPNGEIIGPHKPSCELPFHKSVYSLRKDVKAVLHAHSPALVAFSLVGRCPSSNLAPAVAKTCGKIAFAKYEIPGSEKLGQIIAAEFAKGADSVVMENHGAVMCGETIFQAFTRFEALDYMARIELSASGSGLGELHDLNADFHPTEWETFKPESVTAEECELRDEIVNFRARCYRQKLLFTGSAFIALRLGEDDFVITPNGFDPMYLDANEIVRVCNGKCQAGAVPSTGARVCREIFKKQKHVNAIFMTRPPNIMAFAATGHEMNSRTIPESYINLRDIPLIPAKQYFNDLESVVEKISPQTPVLLIENCGLLTTGKNILEAFDRLEVGEFTAKCILLANRIGSLKPINQDQVDEIIEAFHLPK